MQELITRLLDEGYEVSFTSSETGYVASVSRAGVCECGHAERRHTLHVDDESVPVGNRGVCMAGCECGGYAELSEGYDHDCIAATPLDALVGAAPRALAYEACMVPKGGHPYPDGPDCFCGHGCRDHAIKVGTGGERGSCTVISCKCPFYAHDEPGAEARIEARLASLEEVVEKLEQRTCSEVPLLVRVIGNLVAADVPRCPDCGRHPIDHRSGVCIYPREAETAGSTL